MIKLPLNVQLNMSYADCLQYLRQTNIQFLNLRQMILCEHLGVILYFQQKHLIEIKYF